MRPARIVFWRNIRTHTITTTARKRDSLFPPWTTFWQGLSLHRTAPPAGMTRPPAQDRLDRFFRLSARPASWANSLSTQRRRKRDSPPTMRVEIGHRHGARTLHRSARHLRPCCGRWSFVPTTRCTNPVIRALDVIKQTVGRRGKSDGSISLQWVSFGRDSAIAENKRAGPG
jgi:hypothetical protein